VAYIADLVVVRIYCRYLHPIPRRLTLVQTYSKRVAVESRSGSLVSANVEPFLPVAYSFDRGAAYPHSPSMPFNTFNGLFIWEDPRDDELMFGLAVEYHTKIWEKAIELGVSRREAFFPPNYVCIHQSCAVVVLLTSVVPSSPNRSLRSPKSTDPTCLACKQSKGGWIRSTSSALLVATRSRAPYSLQSMDEICLFDSVEPQRLVPSDYITYFTGHSLYLQLLFATCITLSYLYIL
jgi:hypothetical protein